MSTKLITGLLANKTTLTFHKPIQDCF